MRRIFFQNIIFLIVLLSTITSFGQLGFCTGSKGSPVFDENFGNGTNYGPQLPAGITNYSFVTGSPNDGSYTLFYRTNLYSTWHYSLDHTPDITNGANGKALIVNANANTSGEFYKRTVTGLCVNTTFEFSAWLMNVYNPGSGFCGVGEKPINVRFEIWDVTETTLLRAGNTGDIIGSFGPNWQQYGLVFTTSSQTSVVLKMKNNGVGGCGNDLAIDDIVFRSCGDLTTVSSPSATGNTYAVCQNASPVSITLQATTSGTATYFYQWQSSSDGVNWTDIAGATNPNYTTPNLSSLTFFRTKVAQDVANLSNDFCSTLSNVFTVSFLAAPTNGVSTGDKIICSNETIPALALTTDASSSVNWYNAATGGTLLLANSNAFTPPSAGTYYAETYSLVTGCINPIRIPISLTIVPLPTVAISGTTSICTGNTALVSFNGTPNAIVTYTVDGGANQTIALDSNGLASLTTPALTASSTYTLVSCTSSVLSSCSSIISSSILITVNNVPTVAISGDASICSGTSANLTFTGTASATVQYTVNNGPNQTINLNTNGIANLTTPNLTANATYTLVSVTSPGTNSCTQLVSQSFTVNVVALPTATITATPLSVCSGQNTTLNFNGTPNTLVTYTVNGGTNQSITLDTAGLASVTTQSILANTTFQLVSASLVGSSNCTQLLSGSVVVSINPTPIASYTGSVNYCSNETTAIALSSTIPGTTFTWTATQNGTSGAISGSGSTIADVLTVNGSDGIATYTVTPFYNGCAGNAITINVTVHALPNPTITSGTICLFNSSTTASQPYVLNTNLNTIDYSFDWFFNGVLISNANGSTYNATQIGTYTVIATNNATGCVSNPVVATVSEALQGQSLIIDQTEAFSDNPTVSVTVVGGDGPFLYQLDNSAFQTSNVFYNVASGTHTITVVDATFCTNLSATVTLINYPHFFTPNYDGTNDTWNIKGLTTNSKIHIFDRFGKLLKQITTNGYGWDGTYNGERVLSDDYWFTIDYFENGVAKTFKAHFSLKR